VAAIRLGHSAEDCIGDIAAMKDRVFDYLRANLADPGTMRSLVMACVSIAMNSRAETSVEHYVTLIMFGLCMVSAAIPPKKP
jgi:hypothetical protein